MNEDFRTFDNYSALLACIISPRQIIPSQSMFFMKLLDKEKYLDDLKDFGLLELEDGEPGRHSNQGLILSLNPENGDTLVKFETLSQACFFARRSKASVLRALNSGKISGGFRWKYIEKKKH